MSWLGMCGACNVMVRHAVDLVIHGMVRHVDINPLRTDFFSTVSMPLDGIILEEFFFAFYIFLMA